MHTPLAVTAALLAPGQRPALSWRAVLSPKPSSACKAPPLAPGQRTLCEAQSVACTRRTVHLHLELESTWLGAGTKQQVSLALTI